LADFNYLVITKEGKEKKGNMQADTPEDVKRKLKNDGFTVVSITKASALTKDINISIGKAVKPRDLSVFCRQFISMVNAGVTILDTLDMLAEQTENKAMAKAVRGVHTEIRKGETLSSALAKYPKVFPDIMCSMVAAGEASGKIDVAFERMAVHFEKSAKLRGIVRKAMVYPIIVLVVALIVVVVMLVKVIPSYQDMFEQLDSELPALTLAVVAASDFIMNDWFWIVIAIAAVVIGISAFKKTIPGQVFFGTLARKMPIFGKLTIKQAASNYARTLSTLIYSGLPMMEALAITGNTMSNYLYKQAMNKAREEVAKGVSLSEPIIQCGLFPPMVGHMTKIGEETGDLEGMLTRLADYYDEEVEMTTQTVIAAMEPMIILVLAGLVGVMIGAIMMPMFQLYGDMNNL
jgi:type IV pilus assembly protein PilC